MAFVGQVFGHVEADAAGPDQCGAGTHLYPARQHVHVADDLGVVGAGEGDPARGDAGGQHDLVEAGQVGRSRRGRQLHVHPGFLQPVAEVAQRLVEFLLARNPLGVVELPADLVGRIEQGHAVAALGGDRRAGQSRRARPDHGDGLRRERFPVGEVRLVAGARIDQAAGQLVLEHVVQAGLVAGDAGVDGLGRAGARLGRPLRVGQQRTRQRDHVGLAGGEDAFGDLGHVDPVGRHQRHPHVRLELGGHVHESRARHRGDDGRHARLVPADAGVDDRGTGGFHGLGLLDDLVPLVAVLHQVQQRQAVDDDEVRAHRLAHTTHDLHREAHALLRRAAPGVVALVGARRGEFVDEIAFRTHDFHAVVAGVARQLRGVGVGADLAFDAASRQRARGERIDGRLQLRWCDRQRVIAVAPRMQQLRADLGAVLMHRLGHELVRPGLPRPRQLAAERLQPAHQVGREAAGDDQAHAAGRPLGEVRREAWEILRPVFQARVHRAHQHPVADRGEAQVQRREQVGVGRGFDGGRRHAGDGYACVWKGARCRESRGHASARMRGGGSWCVGDVGQFGG